MLRENYDNDIADDRDDDDGGQIGTKNPLLNDWNKIYRGSDFVSGGAQWRRSVA